MNVTASSTALPLRCCLSATGLAVALALVGCTAASAPAPADDGIETEQSLTSRSKEPGVEVTAAYGYAITGVQNIGDDATEPVLKVHVEVDDEALRKAHPTFDGLERPFVLVPRAAAGGEPSWKRIDLPYVGQSTRGYIAMRAIDPYERQLRVSYADLEIVRARGVSVGLDTNVGTLWAQARDDNIAVERLP